MSNSTRIILVLAMAAAVAGCARPQQEPVVVDTVTVDPVGTGKFN